MFIIYIVQCIYKFHHTYLLKKTIKFFFDVQGLLWVKLIPAPSNIDIRYLYGQIYANLGKSYGAVEYLFKFQITDIF